MFQILCCEYFRGKFLSSQHILAKISALFLAEYPENQANFKYLRQIYDHSKQLKFDFRFVETVWQIIGELPFFLTAFAPNYRIHRYLINFTISLLNA